MYSPKKRMIRLSSNHLNRSPLKTFHRMKSSTPLNTKRFISSNNLGRYTHEKLSRKNSNKESFSIRKHQFEKINTRIIEESESSNLNEENKKNETKNNNYYINYINNIYEREPHLNKENFIKTPSNKIKKYKKLDDINGNLYKRRFSAFSEQFMNLNFHKKYCADKGQHVTSPISKLTSSKLNNLIKKKKSSEIIILRNHSNNVNKQKDKEKSKGKSKNKSKSKGISKEKCKNSDKKLKSNIKLKKIKENTEIKDNEIEISTKVETVNTASNNTKIKNKKLKNLLCCLVNDNDLSTEND